jgi:hypothetical protein
MRYACLRHQFPKTHRTASTVPLGVNSLWVRPMLRSCWFIAAAIVFVGTSEEAQQPAMPTLTEGIADHNRVDEEPEPVSRSAPGNAPTVTSIVDNTTNAPGSTAGNRPVTITGTNFITGATVTIGGVTCVNPVVVNSTTITCRTGPNVVGAASVVVTTTNGSNGANSPYTLNGLTAPLQASAFGFTTLSFEDEFTDTSNIDVNNSLLPGYNWYTQAFGWTQSHYIGGFQDWGIAIQFNASQYYSISSGILTMIGHVPPQPDNYSEFLSAASTNGGTGSVSTTYPAANGYYTEVRMAGRGSSAEANAYWQVALGTLTGANNTTYLEIDMPELGVSNLCNFNLIQWLVPSSSNWFRGPGGCSITDDSFHIYGVLYVPPQSNAGNGFFKFYVDNVLAVTINVTTGSTLANIMATQRNVSILQTDSNSNTNPLQIDYVRTWQLTPNG